MANPPHHREQVRQRIIQSALQLFNRHGFTAASIDDIMAGAGMTRGGYLSLQQLPDVETNCPLIALPNDLLAK